MLYPEAAIFVLVAIAAFWPILSVGQAKCPDILAAMIEIQRQAASRAEALAGIRAELHRLEERVTNGVAIVPLMAEIQREAASQAETLAGIRAELHRLEERVANGVAIARLRRFCVSKVGICDLKNPAPSAPREQEVLLAIGEQFKFTCVVTGAVQPRGSEVPQGTHLFKLAHVVQRKVLGNVEFMNDFDISADDVNAESNLLFLREDFEARLDACDFCFWPHETTQGAFRLQVFGDSAVYSAVPDVISVPDFVSRKMLFIQACDAFRKAGRRMTASDEAAWRACCCGPRDSGNRIAEWLEAVVSPVDEQCNAVPFASTPLA